MKDITLFATRAALCGAACLLPAAWAVAAPQPPQDTATVNVTLDGVRAGAGPLYVSLQSEEQFMREESSASAMVAEPGASTTLDLGAVAPGRYALVVWHDIDRDGEFSMGPMGPLDGWAMIGGERMRGEPSFAEASFLVEGDAVAVRETMIYVPTDRAGTRAGE